MNKNQNPTAREPDPSPSELPVQPENETEPTRQNSHTLFFDDENWGGIVDACQFERLDLSRIPDGCSINISNEDGTYSLPESIEATRNGELLIVDCQMEIKANQFASDTYDLGTF
jgi:hypothetical protein